MHRLAVAVLFSFLCSVGMLLSGSMADAQVTPGMPNFSAYDSHEVDSINLMSNNIRLTVPVWSKAGAVPLALSTSMNSYLFVGSNGWASSADNGMASVNGVLLSSNIGSWGSSTLVQCPGSSQMTTKWSKWYVSFSDTAHYLPAADYVDSYGSGQSCLQSSFTDTTTDGSGITVTVAVRSNGPYIQSAYTPDGTSITLGTSLIATDTNNNVWSYSFAAPLQLTDTMGLTALTATGNSWPFQTFSWTDVNGGTPAVAESNTSILMHTVFACTGIPDVSKNITVASSVSFPDGTSLSLQYQTGRLSGLTLREGALLRTLTVEVSAGWESIVTIRRSRR
jgi:hypothetical protein